MTNYALHFTPGPADDSGNEMYVWFQTDGIYQIEGERRARMDRTAPPRTQYGRDD